MKLMKGKSKDPLQMTSDLLMGNKLQTQIAFRALHRLSFEPR